MSKHSWPLDFSAEALVVSVSQFFLFSFSFFFFEVLKDPGL